MAGALVSERASSSGPGAPFLAFFARSGDFDSGLSPLGNLGACLNQAGSMYSSKPSRPPSRPYPLSRYPPKPQAASNKFAQFTHTTPALICAATCSATLMLSLHTHDASPYTVLLASSTASRGVRNVMAASTGPKISCCATVEAGCTLLSRVGGK